ncbi:hypothetical protein BC826DRAFT_1108660 [Russula brevipes]|nr:hypothetical protein BC826DRAFT_1108660 [Russula brevipes]
MHPHNEIPQKSVQSSVTFPTNIIAQGAMTDGPSEGLQTAERSTHLQGEFNGLRGQAAIDKLTDDALLDIFDFYLKGNRSGDVEEWYTLVHVCRRWRSIVFASPHHLNLRILCTKCRPVRAMLDSLPVLPLEIEHNWTATWGVGQDNIIAALEHPDRVRQIILGATPPVWESLAAAMQVPFPELTSLQLWSEDESVTVFPDSFLGGLAPRLQKLLLGGIVYRAVRSLLLSASDLVQLELSRLPHSGYISPESMVACLSSLNRLESLKLGFQSPQPRPSQPNLPPQTRVVLPALTRLSFRGMIDYSEDLVARIDTPVLKQLHMVFFMDLVFDVPHFNQFVGRAKGLKPFKAAKLLFELRFIRLELDRPHGSMIEVRCNRIDWQVDSMALLCGQLSPFFSLVEQFDIIWFGMYSELQGKDDMEPIQCLEIFRPFTAVRSFYVSKTLVPLIATALQGLIGESATAVLPNLRDLFLDRPALSGSMHIQEAMQSFVAARQLSGQPIAVHHWEALEVDW